MQQKHVISCDWGTSSLRLRLIETTSLRCLAKVSSSQGNALIFNQWKAHSNSDRVAFYLNYLQPLLKELSDSSQLPVTDLCIIISGMASSTVGIKELPYADVPFNLDGSSAYTEWISAKSAVNNQVLLISGVQQSDDVMRGEETQLIGIASVFRVSQTDDSIYILPGTHSKHIIVGNGRITYFKTFMTGEIFEMLTKHTVLSHAVTSPENREIPDDERRAFKDGVNKALKTELLNSLFSVRINQIKNYFSTRQNYYYLSGLLIGSELKYLVSNNNQLVLCSSGNLLKLYELAIETLCLSERTTVVPGDILDNAAAVGQLKILNNIKSVRTHVS